MVFRDLLTEIPAVGTGFGFFRLVDPQLFLENPDPQVINRVDQRITLPLVDVADEILDHRRVEFLHQFGEQFFTRPNQGHGQKQQEETDV